MVGMDVETLNVAGLEHERDDAGFDLDPLWHERGCWTAGTTKKMDQVVKLAPQSHRDGMLRWSREGWQEAWPSAKGLELGRLGRMNCAEAVEKIKLRTEKQTMDRTSNCISSAVFISLLQNPDLIEVFFPGQLLFPCN
jgi:hypothetical protein